MKTLYVGNDHIVELQSLINAVTGEPIEDAMVTLTLKDSNGDNVTAPIAMTHVSSGTYRTSIANTLPITATDSYTAHFDAVGDGIVGHWECTLVGTVRGC